jgi:hypothetical protein
MRDCWQCVAVPAIQLRTRAVRAGLVSVSRTNSAHRHAVAYSGEVVMMLCAEDGASALCHGAPHMVAQ